MQILRCFAKSRQASLGDGIPRTIRVAFPLSDTSQSGGPPGRGRTTLGLPSQVHTPMLRRLSGSSPTMQSPSMSSFNSLLEEEVDTHHPFSLSTLAVCSAFIRSSPPLRRSRPSLASPIAYRRYKRPLSRVCKSPWAVRAAKPCRTAQGLHSRHWGDSRRLVSRL